MHVVSGLFVLNGTAFRRPSQTNLICFFPGVKRNETTKVQQIKVSVCLMPNVSIFQLDQRLHTGFIHSLPWMVIFYSCGLQQRYVASDTGQKWHHQIDQRCTCQAGSLHVCTFVVVTNRPSTVSLYMAFSLEGFIKSHL